jgi:hypothetical protein
VAAAAGMMKHESMKSARMVEAIRQTGGIVSPIIEAGNNRRFDSGANNVANDCPGSSKSWAQNYLYAVDKMGGRGVGWGSETNGITTMPAPRFGSDACKGVESSNGALLGLRSEPNPNAKLSAEQLARRQRDRVQYVAADVAVCTDTGFAQDHLGHIQQGLCMAKHVSGTTWDAINAECLRQAPPCVAGDDCFLRNNVCRGVRAGMVPSNQCDDRTFETGAGTKNRNGACRAQKGWACNTGDRDVESVCVEVTRELQAERAGLPHLVAGSKVFDINTDGFANYGMVPDFLMDLRTVGVTDAQLTPLFRSAEDFLQAWEKIEGTRTRGSVVGAVPPKLHSPRLGGTRTSYTRT